VIDPYVACSKNGDTISVSHSSPPVMARRATNHRIACTLTIMYMETMNYDIRDKLDGDASPVGNVDIGSTSIYGLEAVHDKLLLEGNHHVPLEHNPQRLVLNDSMA